MSPLDSGLIVYVIVYVIVYFVNNLLFVRFLKGNALTGMTGVAVISVDERERSQGFVISLLFKIN